MAGSAVAPIDVGELQNRLRQVDPAALVVPARILRRVIKRDRKLAGIGLQVPHHRGYVIGRDALLQIAEPAELGLTGTESLPDTVILVARPSSERLAGEEPGATLTRYWRMLFHLRVHIALDERVAEHKLSEARIRDRIHRIGQTEFEEIRAVLRQEGLLLPPRDDRTVYIEFAALYLELRYFAHTLLPRYFPAVQQFDCIDQLLAEDVDADALFARTRPAGAFDPVPPPEAAPDGDDEDESVPESPVVSGGNYDSLMERSSEVARVGNLVKAAILKARAAHRAVGEQQARAAAGAAADLDVLTERLRRALDLGPQEAEAWRRVLPVLLERAAERLWPPEARMLYDLQKVCLDHEREIYALDLVEWAVSLGRRPIKRPLPGQQDILSLKHLRGALKRLAGARLPAETRAELLDLLHAAVHHSETKLRERFRPVIVAALEEVGLRPQNLPERVALAKITEELLDQVGERGYLTMGDLRDALSRNNLKLPDLAGPRELVLGDRLIRANRRLAVGLDGIYRRGEIYLRWLQRLSSVAFGTQIGRLATLYLVLPLGGAYVILAGVKHMVELVAEHFGPKPAPEHSGDAHVPVLPLVLLGLFLLALIHVPVFRRAVGMGLVGLFRGLRWLFIDLPAAVLRQPAVRFVLDSRPFLVLKQVALKPLVAGGVAAGLLRLCRAGPISALTAGGLVVGAVAVVLNTRFGRDLEEAFLDWVARTWQKFTTDVVPGLFRLLMAFFKRLIEAVERVLYAVDERLRFKTGDSRLSLVVKPVLGLVWFAVTYVVRFAVNLLIEPQINPIKHFPVVTVSHKLVMTLLVPALAAFFEEHFGLGKGRAIGLAGTIGFGIPGIFGFIAWELKENWRLYQANRSPTLKPVMIGHHGETMARFLRPGFHSGTIPKLYAKLRKAQRRGMRTGRWKPFRKHRETLDHLEESIRHFFERELITLLEDSNSWGALPLEVGKVALGSNRVRVELCCPRLGSAGVWVTFEELSGWLVAGVAEPGWLGELNPEQTQAITAALAGLYKMSGVDLVREQVEASLGPKAVSYDMTGDGLVVWPGNGEGCEVIYPLRDGAPIEPRTSACPPEGLPVLDASRLLFRDVPVTWVEWVDGWERDQAGKGPPPEMLPDVRLLPTHARAQCS
jgi:hypothetical protein